MPELKFQATPRQWALIGVLGAVLVTVLVLNRPADSAAGSSVGLAALPPAKRAASNPALSPTIARPRLPEFTAQEVAAVNPFPRPKSASKPAQTAEAAAGNSQKSIDAQQQRKLERAKALAELRSKKVRFVIENEQGGAALLGDQPVRLGEIVSGFRVVKIDETGVELVPAE